MKLVLVLSACCVLTAGCRDDGGCDFGGKHYASGATFKDSNLCNTCQCTDDGQVGCTTMACAPLLPQNGSWCMEQWGTWGTASACHVSELNPDGTVARADLPACAADGGVADPASACFELADDPSCSGTGKRLVIAPESETSGRLFRLACY